MGNNPMSMEGAAAEPGGRTEDWGHGPLYWEHYGTWPYTPYLQQVQRIDVDRFAVLRGSRLGLIPRLS